MKRGWLVNGSGCSRESKDAAFHQRRLPQERKRFLIWWEEWRKTGQPKLAAMLGGEPAEAASDVSMKAGIPIQE